MSSINHKPEKIYTHEGAVGKRINAEQSLRRSVMSCLLWENEFYEDGKQISDRIRDLVPLVDPKKVYEMAIEARNKMHIRHAPLLIAREMAKHPPHKAYVRDTLKNTIQRADELTEFLSIYWKNGKQPLSAQVKKGLASAFTKFDAYELAKYNRDNIIKIKDVLFLCHAKPEDKRQEKLWKQLINNELKTPETWEVALSAGKDKKRTFERLIKDKKIGGMALIRNLRNMKECGVDKDTVEKAFENTNLSKVLPFRFISAARHCPSWEDIIEKYMLSSIRDKKRLKGKTVILVDVSGSMDKALSSKSEMSRIDAACGVAIILRELCDNVVVFSFSENLVTVPQRHGFALRDAIENSQCHSSTYMGAALNIINDKEDYDRVVVITDEQSADKIPNPKGVGYIINVASDKNGVDYREWTHINGWSDAVTDYISTCEQ